MAMRRRDSRLASAARHTFQGARYVAGERMPAGRRRYDAMDIAGRRGGRRILPSAQVTSMLAADAYCSRFGHLLTGNIE